MSSSVKSRKLIDVLRYFVLCENSEQRNAIVDYVRNNIDKKEQSVAMCFRGDYVCLYYRCHMLLLIKYYNKKLIGEFNFRHSHFTEDYEKKEERLRAQGVYNFNTKKYMDEGVEKSNSFDSINIRFDIAEPKLEGDKWTYAGLIERDALEEILDIYKGLIEDFVNPEKNVYRWQGEKDKPKINDIAYKSRNIE